MEKRQTKLEVSGPIGVPLGNGYYPCLTAAGAVNHPEKGQDRRKIHCSFPSDAHRGCACVHGEYIEFDGPFSICSGQEK